MLNTLQQGDPAALVDTTQSPLRMWVKSNVELLLNVCFLIKPKVAMLIVLPETVVW
jgi:hypothetical protein